MDAKKTVILVVVGGVGVYLTYKYLDDNGYLTKWLPSLFPAPGTPANPQPGAAPPAPPPPASNVTPIAKAPPAIAAALLDTSGLKVVPDVNDSLRGTVKIAGVPITLAIIQSDGRIFDTSGAEVSAKLEKTGVDLGQLRAAFMAAGSGLSGYQERGGMGYYTAAAGWAT